MMLRRIRARRFRRRSTIWLPKAAGRLIVPKGTYRLAGVRLRSNIHLLIEKDTVIKPYWPEGMKTVVFLLDADRPANKRKMTPEQERAFIENVSIRGLGGRWIVDYSNREPKKGEGVRAVLATMVRNFLIADLDVKDNFTTYCGITLTPLQTKSETKDWPVSRATDGTIRNCRIYNASPGYGLTQLHGAQSVHFEDIYAKGGVTLRLETGAVGLRTGVYRHHGQERGQRERTLRRHVRPAQCRQRRGESRRGVVQEQHVRGLDGQGWCEGSTVEN
jgi:hypothetical protein